MISFCLLRFESVKGTNCMLLFELVMPIIFFANSDIVIGSLAFQMFMISLSPFSIDNETPLDMSLI